jgi:hypothetical protein
MLVRFSVQWPTLLAAFLFSQQRILNQQLQPGLSLRPCRLPLTGFLAYCRFHPLAVGCLKAFEIIKPTELFQSFVIDENALSTWGLNLSIATMNPLIRMFDNS